MKTAHSARAIQCRPNRRLHPSATAQVTSWLRELDSGGAGEPQGVDLQRIRRRILFGSKRLSACQNLSKKKTTP
jgi:hypothetical protein